MDGDSTQILLIEDNKSVAALIQAMLEKSKVGSFKVTAMNELNTGIEYLHNNIVDAVLLDLSLPDSNGLATLTKMHSEMSEHDSKVPIIVLTGVDDEALAMQAVHEGAQEYIVKGDVDARLLVRAVLYAIERKHAEDEIRKARDELEKRVQKRTAELQMINECLKQEIEERKLTEDKLRKTQEQLIQAAKMQVVGGLASGVAHEVKNPLAIILQGVEYLENKIPQGDKNVALTLKYIKNAIDRADTIVRGLLDFSSVSQLNISTQKLTPVLEKSLMLLKHQFDKNHIRIIKEFQAAVPEVQIDRNKIEQVFINLIMNSIDAMPKGGELVIREYMQSKSNISSEEIKQAGINRIEKQDVVVVEIEDTGSGISEDALQCIFDPFFTTKRAQGGTGLGLSIVRNILKTHQASINISNKKDKKGTKTKIVFTR